MDYVNKILMRIKGENMNEQTLLRIVSVSPGFLVMGFGVACMIATTQVESSIEKTILLFILVNMIVLGSILTEVSLILFRKRMET